MHQDGSGPNESVEGEKPTPPLSCPRWSADEEVKLAEMRGLLAEDLAAVPRYHEVVGDRRLLRFLRGHNHDLRKATSMYRKFLKYRRDRHVDRIRDEIRE